MGRIGASAVAGFLLTSSFFAPCRAQCDEPALERPSVEAVVSRMLELNASRAAALRQYSSQRRYVAENRHFAKRAEVFVQELYMQPGKKELKIISASGSPFVQRKVIEQLLEAEMQAAQDENRDQTFMAPQNYKFRLLGTEEMEGHPCYVLEVIPKAAKKYLMRGRIWVEKAEYAIVRMEGSPAKNPSFWTRRVHIVRRYEKRGPFWLPSSVESESDLLIAGKSTLKIDYLEYRIGDLLIPPAGERATFSAQESTDERPHR